jgi:hypothetical protein
MSEQIQVAARKTLLLALSSPRSTVPTKVLTSNERLSLKRTS